MNLVTKNLTTREEVDLFLPWCLRSTPHLAPGIM